MASIQENQWAPVVLRKNPSKPKTQAEIQRAKANGNLTTEKKFGNANSSTGPSNAAKLDAETGDFRVQKISTDFKVALMQARQAKGWNQKELAAKIGEKQTLVQQYEAGKAVPNGQIISKLNRQLGVTLPKLPKVKKSKNDDF